MPSSAQAPVDSGASPDAAGYQELRSAHHLREMLGAPMQLVIDKVKQQLTEPDVDLLARSPICFMSTADRDGNCDVSPRGDAPGFVHVVDAGTVALPDRPGNRRVDNFHNILQNPHVGLIHLVPGSPEILRINGRARLLTDAPFFDLMAVNGRRPQFAVLVEIDEVFRHCPKSLHRAGIWQPETWAADPDRG